MRRFTLLAALLGLMVGCDSSPSPVAPSVPVVTPTPIAAPAPTISPVVRGPQFNQSFWNQLIHNGFDAPPGTVPLRRLLSAPNLYLKTVDEAGVAIDPVTLSSVESAMRDVAPIWGGGQFGLASVERGTGTRAGQSGWITVRWLATNVGAICGQATVGVDGGFIELNYQNPNTNCTCGNGVNLAPRTAKHELGHAFGYYHTDSQDDVMRNGALGCDKSPSPREVYHATIAYQTPIGATDARGTATPIVLD